MSLADLLGPLIGFSGTGFTGCVQLECLTECFTLHTDLHEDAMAIRAARAFGALRIAFDKFCKYYQNLPKPAKADRVPRVTFPYPDSRVTDGVSS